MKVQPPNAPGGRFTKDAFDIDLDGRQVTCPERVTVADPPHGTAGCRQGRLRHRLRHLPAARRSAPTSKTGRSITIGHHEARLAAARARQTRPRLAGRLPGHPTQGRTQNRPPDAPPPRRTPRPHARPCPRSPPTSPCSPPRSTSPDSPCSESCPQPVETGRSPPADRPKRPRTIRTTRTRPCQAFNGSRDGHEPPTGRPGTSQQP